ncbi:MAG: hypothetical protein ACRCTJ_07550, partial [Brevinema sp.]
PLLQTNTAPNLESVSLKKFRDLPINKSLEGVDIQFDVEEALANLSPSISQTNTQVPMATPTITPIISPQVEIVVDDPANTDTPAEDEPYGEKEVTEDNDSEDETYEEDYEKDIYAQLTYMDQQFIAQLISSLESNQYVINIGGQNGGIFVHRTRNPEKPYKVIFLSMESGITLYELSIDNSFDVRFADAQAIIEARELYIKLLNDRINFQKYEQINTSYFND